VARVQFADAFEEQAVLRHRIIDARAGEDQAVRAAERRDHDGQRHQRRAARPENRGEGGGSDAIVRGRLNLMQSQRREIADIGQDVERDHHGGTYGERERDVSFWIFHFARGERDVVPGVRGKERADLRNPERDQKAKHSRGRGHRGDKRLHPVGAGLDGLRIVQRPDAGEICVNRFGVAAHEDSGEDQRREPQQFGRGEHVLDPFAEFQAARVERCQEKNQEKSHKLLNGQTDRVFFRESDRRDHPSARRDRRPNDTEKAREPDSHCRDRARLNDQKQRPAVQKTPQRRIRFAKVNVLTTGLRHHGSEFAVRERRGNRHQSRDDPGDEQASGRAGVAGNVGGHDENARADHRADDDGRRIEQAQAANESGGFCRGWKRSRDVASCF
jgi:hypothetical protein